MERGFGRGFLHRFEAAASPWLKGKVGVLKVEPSDITPNAMGVTPLIAAAGLGMEPSPRFNPSAKDAQDRSIATLELLFAAGADGSSDNRPSPEVAKILQTAIGQ